MAGDHGVLKVDPAIERWAEMRANQYKHFAWSRRSTRLGLFFGVFVPVGLAWLAFKTNNKWDFAAAQTKEDMKRK